ncbi:beta family protein [Comamonas thiooxydans]|uniref:Beta family protein n=1 Tax=Comamonas thiooxydans TaxID=363952 RepID=A0AA42TRX6_9BURK|nr:hypothetical protein [Comamonas thiooxydans]MDH1337502.1 beta family protein [Comamonas thiooxydans]MDH1743671.1 beta family protein [Comamonas thiooxydans]MDH1789981.1 beta family protein [Comamonas thiooxydans]
MEYAAALKVGQNDIKALVNLESFRRDRFAPILMMRGIDRKYIDNFLQTWGPTNFYLDTSRYKIDEDDPFLVSSQVNDPSNFYKNKFDFYQSCKSINNSLIPTVGWKANDPAREIVQFALNLEKSYECIAIRFDAAADGDNEINIVRNILNSVQNPKKFDVIIDYGKQLKLTTTPSNASAIVNELMKNYGVRKIILLSSSFPEDKPPSGTTRYMPCNDLIWQIPFIRAEKKDNIIYGDYAATNPDSIVEYIPGMAVIPFANYLETYDWWQGRKGKDKEFSKYVDLAKDIISLPGYHGDNFCWATKEISRIAKLPAIQGERYGSNGSWNGYKVNQHICAILENFSKIEASSSGSQGSGQADEDEDEF